MLIKLRLKLKGTQWFKYTSNNIRIRIQFNSIQFNFIYTDYNEIQYTVEPVLSGTVLSGHPLLSGQLSKSRKLLPLFTVILTCIKRSPLLSGRGHPILSPSELFLLS